MKNIIAAVIGAVASIIIAIVENDRKDDWKLYENAKQKGGEA